MAQKPKTFANSSRKEIAEALFGSIGKFFHLSDPRRTRVAFKEVHLSPSLRADVLSMNWDDKVVIVEVKSSKEDFKTDSKWKDYLEYCDYFYFLCPEGVILPADLPSNIGLVWASGSIKSPFLKIIKRPYRLKASKLNSAWFRQIYKRLAFRKFAKFNGLPVSLDDDQLF